MRLDDFLIKEYYKTADNSNKILDKVKRMVIRYVANITIPSLSKKVNMSIVREDVIVSLTSFPDRINNIWKVINCILNQTVLPKKIILWLSSEQFKNIQLPKKLTDLLSDRFEIHFTDSDIKSHKKYYYLNESYHDKLAILIDDDIFYPTDMIESLLAKYDSAKDKKTVVCRYCREIKYNSDREFLPYNDWNILTYSGVSPKKIFFGSGGGTLIPIKYLPALTWNRNVFMELCPKADDIWLNAMCKLGNMPIVLDKFSLPLPIFNFHSSKLYKENLLLNYNDRQIRDLSLYLHERSLSKIPSDIF